MNFWIILGLVVIAAFIVGLLIGRVINKNRQSSDPFANLTMSSAGNMPPVESKSVQDLLREGRKIEAIKRYRQENGVGLKEAKDAVDRLALGIPVPNRFDDFDFNGKQPADGDEKKDSFGGSSNYASSRLDDEIRDLLRRGNKINAIKRYREVKGVGLKEAKEAVDRMEEEMRQGGRR
jgi:ribosomal protein L7/L12